ncbi:MAG TPA: glutathione S-transferase family protein [Thermoanaerobaculia bacterium]|nr:glutathione S-transferase family protein [Thermoanaerobaculia bacterium]
MSDDRWTLYATRGTGSTVVEAAIERVRAHRGAGEPGFELERVEVEYTDEGPQNPRLFELNPLGQLPTLVLADGAVMTESAAIVLWLAERHPAAGLAPLPGAADRPRFLRLLVFLVAAIYPTFTYGDFPARWVAAEHGGGLVASTNRHRERLWRWVETQAAPDGPWFLGERFSALDLYAGTMTRWRPRRPWFAEHCPRLDAIAQRVDGLPELAAVWARNFPPR